MTATHPSFEETYPKAPFADLIRLALTLADKAVKLRAWLTSHGAVSRQHA